jgi:hypothetical protein
MSGINNNSKPKAAAPVVVLREDPSDMRRYFLRLLPAGFASVMFHAVLIGLFLAYFYLIPSGQAEQVQEEARTETINAEPVEEKKETFSTIDVDLSMQERDQDIQYKNERIADVSVPGTMNPNEAVGIMDGDKSAPPVNIPAPGGFGTAGQGGAIESFSGPGNSNAVGEIGGYGPRGLPLQGS